MELMTRIDIPVSEWKMEAGAKVLLVGSCFADAVGEKLRRGGFEAMVNPFGTLYNPASIAVSLLRSVSEKEVAIPLAAKWGGFRTSKSESGTSVGRSRGHRLADVGDIVFEGVDGVWHSWMHHSCFSSADVATLVERINSTTHRVADFLREADVLIVTLGTAVIYRLKESGMLVSNCHKQPDSLFVRERMNAYDIVDQWQMLLQLLESVNSRLKVIFTVSPIRHKRDGYHANQVSKGILLQAVDAMVGADGVSRGDCSKGQRSYFPSYEIMMDELRDYRFYADDMIHPSAQAVEYIWRRFQDTYMDNRTKDAVAKATKEWARRQHRTIVDS
ncbi:MAG: GSCFA domain-containing protein [Bacteroidaceae bacterium]|nr:GSCFA domain-containing protein [Bacteroidaceae bacterium]